MPAILDITLPIAGSPLPLRLYAEGALYWPQGGVLFITDPHFGKADSFHHAGIAIPTAILDHDLARLTRLLCDSAATHLVVLGDFFHTRHSQSDHVLRTLHTWRSRHSDITMTLVLGNHDAHAGMPPPQLDIQATDAPYLCGPFECHHHPQPQPSATGYILAGHLHPYVVLRDRDGSNLRLPACIVGPEQAILPAFGGFTGGHAYAPSTGDRVFVMAQGEIVEIPVARPHRTTQKRR